MSLLPEDTSQGAPQSISDITGVTRKPSVQVVVSWGIEMTS